MHLYNQEKRIKQSSRLQKSVSDGHEQRKFHKHTKNKIIVTFFCSEERQILDFVRSNNSFSTQNRTTDEVSEEKTRAIEQRKENKYTHIHINHIAEKVCSENMDKVTTKHHKTPAVQ